MINVSHYLTASAQNGALVLSVRDPESYFYVVGSTLKSNAPKSSSTFSSGMTSLVLYPDTGEEGLIGLYLNIFQGRDQKKRTSHSTLSVFLKVSQVDGEARIDLSWPWLPTERIGTLTHGEIQVQIRDRVFTSASLYGERKPGDPYPKMDGDLLVRYLFGKATAADVIHSAAQPLLEESARAQLDSAQNRIKGLTKTNEELCRNLGELLDDNEQSADFARKLYNDCRILRDALRSAKWLYKLLKKVPPIFISQRLNDFFTNFERVEKMPERQLPA